MFKNEKAFTLVEMLIVLLIISVLIILIVPNLNNSSKDINEQGCNALLTVTQTQINLFYIENDRYPADLDELVSEGYLTPAQIGCTDEKMFNYDKDDGIVSRE